MPPTPHRDIQYFLILHGDAPHTVTVIPCDTEKERELATIQAIFGESPLSPEHTEEAEKSLQTLREDQRLDFEGDAPIQWMTGFLQLPPSPTE